MRIAWFNVPMYGHVNQTLGIVREVTNAGHEVFYFAFERHRKEIEEAGAHFLACDGYYPVLEDVSQHAMIFSDLGHSAEIILSAALALEGMVAGHLDWIRPDLIVSDVFSAWGKLAAMKRGIPNISSMITFAWRPEMLNRRNPECISREEKDSIKFSQSISQITLLIQRLKDRGYPLTSFWDVFPNEKDQNILVYNSRYLQPHGELFSERYRFIGPIIRPAKTIQEKAAEKTVYVSMGTEVNNLELYKNCIRALSGSKYQVIISLGKNSGFRKLLSDPLPENIRIYDYVDQMAVLSIADAFITHCGINSVNEGLYFQVPLILCPIAWDQFFIAERVEELGAGLRLASHREKDILNAVTEVLFNPKYKAEAIKISKSLRACGGAKEALEVMEKAAYYGQKEGLTMRDTLWRGICEALGDRIALRGFVKDDRQELREISYGELRSFTERLLWSLKKKVPAKSRIAVVMEPGIESILLFLVLMCSEYAVVLISPDEGSEELLKKLKRAKAALLVDPSEVVSRRLNGFPLWGRERVNDLLNGDGKQNRQTDMEGLAEIRQLQEDEAFLLFTSGTTGIDKCVVRTQQNAAAVLSEMMRSHHYGEEQLLVLPAFHLFAIEKLILPAIALGRTLNISRGMRYWTEEIREYGITELFAVPAQAALLAGLMDADGEKDLPLRFLISAGAALPGNTAEALDLAGIQAVSEYGSSEGGSIGHPDYYGGRYDIRPGAVGKIRPYLEYRIQRADPDGFGELWLKGPSIAPVYLDEKGKPYPTCEDGWFCTGDVGRVDEEGFLYLKGRTKNLIILESGENVSPEELEALFLREEGIRECQAFEYRGDICMLLVPEEVEEESVKDGRFLKRLSQVNASLPSYKRIHAFYLSRPLERTSTGKLKRHGKVCPDEKNRIRLPEEASLQGEGRPGFPVQDAVLAAFRKAFGKAEIGLEDDFFALGGDSLCAMKIRSLLSGWGYPVKIRELFEHASGRELASFLEQNRMNRKADETDFQERLKQLSKEDRIAPDIPDKTFRNILSDFGKENVEAVYRAEGTTGINDLAADKYILQLSGAYFQDRLMVLRRPLERDVFFERVREVVDRHPVLRSRWIKDEGVWYQVVLRSQEPEAFYEDRRSFGESAAQRLREIRKEYLKRYDLRRQEELSKLFQARCFRISDEQCVLLVEMTHQSMDRYSEELLLRELAEGVNPEEKDEYHRFMLMESYPDEEERAEAEGFWRDFVKEVEENGYKSLSAREAAEVQKGKGLSFDHPLEIKLGKKGSGQVRKRATELRITPAELIGYAYGQSYMEYYGLSGMVFTEHLAGREWLSFDPGGTYGPLSLSPPCILRKTDGPRDFHEQLLKISRYARKAYRHFWKQYEMLRPLMDKLLFDESWLSGVNSLVNYTGNPDAVVYGTDIAMSFLREFKEGYRIDILHTKGEEGRRSAEAFSRVFLGKLNDFCSSFV